MQLTDYKIQPSPIAVEAGRTLRFRVVNTGTVQHEFRLTNGHDLDEHLISDELQDETIGHPEGESTVVVLISPGETREVDVEFTDDLDVYTIAACLIRGHYEAGMWASLRYEKYE